MAGKSLYSCRFLDIDSDGANDSEGERALMAGVQLPARIAADHARLGLRVRAAPQVPEAPQVLGRSSRRVSGDATSGDGKSPPAHYTLKYNLMPYVGALTYGEIARTSEPVPFPESRDLS